MKAPMNMKNFAVKKLQKEDGIEMGPYGIPRLQRDGGKKFSSQRIYQMTENEEITEQNKRRIQN